MTAGAAASVPKIEARGPAGRRRPTLLISFFPRQGGVIAYLYARLVRAKACPRPPAIAHAVGSRPASAVRVSRQCWAFRVRGGFVCPICGLPCGVGISVSAPVFLLLLWRFRLSKLLAWCLYWSFRRWFWSFCLCGGFAHFPLWPGPRVARPSPNSAASTKFGS